jgi:hypothetical protein
MSEVKHTPGPWFRNISAKYPIYAGPKGNHTHVASILSEPEYREGDLRLIAAAPELLATVKSQRLMLYAFKAARENFGLPDNHRELNEAIAETDAAISKATGDA